MSRAPGSTLFPYTTLFRSYYPTEWHEPYIGRRRELGYDLYAKLGIARDDVAARTSQMNRDRKSTRLNSSHGYISYAVFCLKKKISELHYPLSLVLARHCSV